MALPVSKKLVDGKSALMYISTFFYNPSEMWFWVGCGRNQITLLFLFITVYK